ncbi:phospholipase A2 inhibitor and Ly6/PLAUR domain-containing protein-like [Eleutherodactylus coqui]|uniref:phospholipase A2 inhibitor and Ly6/PLAUR domain-containing protein-like n=1 Tax=Eleutherodactylus coqui TaxID=57060 RepID=UPI0034631CC6
MPEDEMTSLTCGGEDSSLEKKDEPPIKEVQRHPMDLGKVGFKESPSRKVLANQSVISDNCADCVLCDISLGSALWCTECTSRSSECTGNNITCPNGTVCGSTYIKRFRVAENKTTEYLTRNCIDETKCSFNGTVTSRNDHIETGVSCCDTDNCTAPLPTFSNSFQPNNVTCRSCVSEKSTWCYTSDTIACKGDENMCLLLTTQTGSASEALRGCATKSICDLSSQSNIMGSSMKLTFKCTNGGIRLHKVVLSPTIVCLLLLKLLL